MIKWPTAMAGKACRQDKPTASIELASCHAAAFVASETQYATKFQVDHVLLCGGTGSISLLLHEELGPKRVSSLSSAHEEGLKMEAMPIAITGKGRPATGRCADVAVCASSY